MGENNNTQGNGNEAKLRILVISVIAIVIIIVCDLVFLCGENINILACNFDGDDSELTDYAGHYESVLYDNLYKKTVTIIDRNNLSLGNIHVLVEYTNLTEEVKFSFRIETRTFLRRKAFDEFSILDIRPQLDDNTTISIIELGPKVIDLKKNKDVNLSLYLDHPNYVDVKRFLIRYRLKDDAGQEFTPIPIRIDLNKVNEDLATKTILSPFYNYKLPENECARWIITLLFLVFLIIISIALAMGIVKPFKEKWKIKVLKRSFFAQYYSGLITFYVSFWILFNSSLAGLWLFSQIVRPSVKLLVLAFAILLFIQLIIGLYIRYQERDMKSLLKNVYNEGKKYKVMEFKKVGDKDILSFTIKEEEKSKEEQYKEHKKQFKISGYKEIATGIASILLLIYYFYGWDFVKILSIL